MSAAFPAPPDRARVARLRARLSAWYRAARRDLPWRRTRDPYAIWVSEVMLQQTRVEAVIGHWRRFLERFPTIAALAAADEDAVLAAWSGLGYYRRARALHAAARLVEGEHAGRFPDTLEAALALPGVGRYTAGAVLSIARGQRRPIVDGNVERVFSRLFDLDAPSGSAPLVAECWRLAERLVPRAGGTSATGGPGEWNQALMELGASVCTPRAPACEACPVARSCRARRAGRAADLPRPRARPPTVPVLLELAWAERAGRVLLERRPPTGRMAGMWQLPTRELAGEDGARWDLFPARWPAGAALQAGEPLLELRHTITRHRIRARLRRAVAGAEAGGGGAGRGPALRWVERAALGAPGGDGLPLTGMTRKALAALERRAGASRRNGTRAPG